MGAAGMRCDVTARARGEKEKEGPTLASLFLNAGCKYSPHPGWVTRSRDTTGEEAWCSGYAAWCSGYGARCYGF
jgi:hypothetical protein